MYKEDNGKPARVASQCTEEIVRVRLILFILLDPEHVTEQRVRHITRSAARASFG